MRFTGDDKKWLDDTILQAVKTAVSAAVVAAVATLHKDIAGMQSTLEGTRLQLAAVNDKLMERDNRIIQLEQTTTNLQETTTNLQEKLISSVQRNVSLRAFIEERSDHHEQYSRKDSLRINGVVISDKEDNESLKAAVIDELSENGVSINEQDIFRLHRSGKPSPLNKFKEYLNKTNDKKQVEIDANDTRQTAEVIVRFTNWSARSRVYKLHYEKDLSLRVKCDLTRHRQEVLSLARDYIKTNNLAGYVYNNAECSLVLNDTLSRKRHYFETFREFSQLAKMLMQKDPVGRDATLSTRR